jgi:hypothetical protein
MSVTGEVEFRGTLVASTDGGVGFEKAKVQDGDFDTYFYTDVNNGYIGMDFGVAVEVTEVGFAVANNSTAGASTARTLKGSNVSATASLTTIQAIGIQPVKFTNQFTPIAVSLGGTTYRYVVLIDTSNSFCTCGELRFYGVAGTAANARPIAPIIAPWGGHYPAGSTTVTITSRTTSAAIYYTTDGTSPTTSSTLYTGPFTLTIGSATVTVKAIAHDAGCSTTDSTVSVAPFHNYGFTSGDAIYDQLGNVCQLDEPVILDDTARTGKYYIYGQIVQQPQSGSDVTAGPGVLCYSSTDLYNWRYEGQILDANGATYVDRPQCRYNASTSKYVLWAIGRGIGAFVATSSSPTSGFTWQDAGQLPSGATEYFDFSFAVANDGTTAYILYNSDKKVVLLASDWLSFTATAASVPVVGEGFVLFQWGSTWFAIYADTNFYDSVGTPFDPRYIYTTAGNPLSGWSAPAALFASDPAANDPNNGQPASVLFVTGADADKAIYTADFWTQARLPNSRPIFNRLTLTSATTIRAEVSPATWALSDIGVVSAPTVPDAPTLGVDNVEVAEGGIQVSPQAPASDGDSPILTYEIYRNLNSAGYALLTTIAPANLASGYLDTGTTAGDTVDYKARCTNALGNSSYSSVQEVTSQGPVPATPANLALSVDATGITLTWDLLDNRTFYTDLFYRIQRSRNGTTWSAKATLADPTATYKDTATADTGVYYYRIIASSAAYGTSAPSGEQHATAQGPHSSGWTPPRRNAAHSLAGHIQHLQHIQHLG